MDKNTAVLHAAYAAWMAGAQLRQQRQRNKRFTYGDQWGDTTLGTDGRTITERERFTDNGQAPLTNNLLRGLVKTIVGRFRNEHLQTPHADEKLRAAATFNQLDELDSRALEEFLIAGCCVQRIDHDMVQGRDTALVRNVNLNHFFINSTRDTRGWDCELVGQCHDLTLPQLLHLVAAGSRRKAAWVRSLYCEQAAERTTHFITSIGGDTATGTDFWRARDGRCRAIEVWTLESHEVMWCHNRKTAQLTMTPYNGRRPKAAPDVTMRWDIATTWHCRWFSPMGDLLVEYDSPWPHHQHPFVFKFYPLTDGEVHSFIEDTIDQQKYVNRLISLVESIMMNSAKGVLLYPENALPDGYTWEDVRSAWSSTGGILPYNPQYGDARPEQIACNGTNIGAYDMIALQLRLLNEVSGVSGALQGKSDNSRSATVYEMQAHNAAVALTDIFDTFNAFRNMRNTLLLNH